MAAVDRPFPSLSYPRSPLHPFASRRQPGASAMAAVDQAPFPFHRPPPPFPINVLGRIVCVGNLVAKPGEEWWEIPCASKKAIGCSVKMQKAVEGLKLYARLGDGPLLASSLSIRMTADARRRFESELGPVPIGTDFTASAVVEMAEQEGVTSIVLSFRRRASVAIRLMRPLSYLLIYDSTNRSLAMFQIPRDEGVCTGKVIVPKRTDGCDYKLFLLGREAPSPSHRDDVSFWVGSLSSSDGTAVPSKFKSMIFPAGEIHKSFKVDVAFSFQGKGFWGDLRQGLVYCDLQASGDYDMDFGFIKLPSKCMADEEAVDPLKQMRKTRTLGCTGGSIWFVCIDTPSHWSNAVVCIWELAFPGGQLKWKRTPVGWKLYREVPVQMLWELDSFKESGLPEAPFHYPILTADDALCFVLVDQSRFPRNERPMVDHFCSFDIHCPRLLWHGLVHNYPIHDSIVMYPSSNFLQMKQSPCNMSSAEDSHDAGLTTMAGGEHSPAAGQLAMTRGVREVVRQFEKIAVGETEQVK